MRHPAYQPTPSRRRSGASSGSSVTKTDSGSMTPMTSTLNQWVPYRRLKLRTPAATWTAS